MESLENTLTELAIEVPPRTHSPEDASSSFRRIEEASSLALNAARSYGNHCSVVTTSMLLGMLHVRGCPHVGELESPNLDLPEGEGVMSGEIYAVRRSTRAFHNCIWGFIGEAVAKIAMRRTLGANNNLGRWLDEVPRRGGDEEGGPDSGIAPQVGSIIELRRSYQAYNVMPALSKVLRRYGA